MTYPHPKGNFVPKAVLMKFGIKSLNTVGQNFSKAAVSINTARPINTAYTRPTVNSARKASNVLNKAHTHVRRPDRCTDISKITRKPSKTGKHRHEKRKSTREAKDSKPKPKKVNSQSTMGQQRQSTARIAGKRVIDSGCSRHMTGNKSYLSDYKEIDGGFVAFGGDPKGGRITGKGKISIGRKPALSSMRPFGCPVTILNTLDHLGKFDGKADEGFFVGYSTNSKAYRVFNNRTMIVEENLHVKFSEETPNIAGNRPNWLFDIDALTISMNYKASYPSWVEAMQDELLQFKLQKVWTLVDLPHGKRAIGTKWVYKNKKDDRGIVVRNKAKLLAQGYTQEEGIDYDKVFALVARITSEVGRKMMDLHFRHTPPLITLPPPPQDKYVADILKKFNFATVKTTSTPIKTNKALLKDEEVEDVDVYLYRSMIGSLMYLTTSRPDIMFVVCACARFQVTPKVSHLHVVKRIFRYLKGQPKLGLWYPRDSPFDLEAFSNSDYVGASLDRKSTTGAEYVVAANFCGQVLWIQNQMLDYGFNFMNTKIHIDNESTICIVKNPVFHSKTKHIEIRHHFIRDSYEKKLIQVIKIHTDHNVADLLTKAFDVSRFNFLIASIGLLNL
ncbi:putative ribonuclease H-like domain-containing protein [Tanacetum coccineum]